MGFLKNEDYEELPIDDGEAFAKLEAISRDRLYLAPRDRDENLPYEETLRYMNEIAAIAHEFGIPDIDVDFEDSNYLREFNRFTRSVDYRLAQIRVQRSRRDQRNSVSITGPTREKIQHYLERLKDEIAGSEISERRKQALLDKITEFEAELSKRRVNLAAVMTVVALVSSVVHDNAETLLEGPKIISAISAIFGKAKIEEEEAAPRLPKPEPFKAIPDLRRTPEQRSKAVPSFDADLDDEVPF